MTSEENEQEAAKSMLAPISKSLDDPYAKRPRTSADDESSAPVFLDEMAGYGGPYENPLPWNK